MKFKFFLFLIISFSFFCSNPCRATHYIGSNFYYDFKGFTSGGDAILQIHLYLYRDAHANNLNTLQSVELGVYLFDGNSNYKLNRLKTISSTYINKEIIPINKEHCYLSDDQKVLEDYYTDTIQLPKKSFRYYIVFTDCCRNYEENIPTNFGNTGPGQSETPGLGMYLIYKSNIQINNSARILKSEEIFICANEEVELDFSGQDPDGDSLEYISTAPRDSIKFFQSNYPNNLNLTFPSIPYNSGYSESIIFGPGGTSQIDPKTGKAKFLSTRPGNYALAILVQEFRGGSFISFSVLDKYIHVIDCPVDLPKSNLGCNSKLNLPNAFSPNGDGVNDVFLIDPVYLENFNLKIYSRWGVLVFESDDPNFKWEGKNNNIDLNSGIYAVIVNAQGLDGKVFNLKSILTLSR